jgi:hypothetical protein
MSRPMYRAMHLAFVVTSSWSLSAIIILVTIVYVIVLLIAYTILFPFDLAYRAVKQRISE